MIPYRSFFVRVIYDWLVSLFVILKNIYSPKSTWCHQQKKNYFLELFWRQQAKFWENRDWYQLKPLNTKVTANELNALRGSWLNGTWLVPYRTPIFESRIVIFYVQVLFSTKLQHIWRDLPYKVRISLIYLTTTKILGIRNFNNYSANFNLSETTLIIWLLIFIVFDLILEQFRNLIWSS